MTLENSIHIYLKGTDYWEDIKQYTARVRHFSKGRYELAGDVYATRASFDGYLRGIKIIKNAPSDGIQF